MPTDSHAVTVSEPMPVYLTTAEVAAQLRVSPIVVAHKCRAGKIAAANPDGRWLITQAAVDAYVRRAVNRTDDDPAA